MNAPAVLARRWIPTRGAPRALWRAALAHPSIALGVLLMLAVALVAIVGPFVFPGDPWDMAGPPMLWPGDDAAYPLGTDFMGRDLATGMAAGARVSLLIGLVSTARRRRWASPWARSAAISADASMRH